MNTKRILCFLIALAVLAVSLIGYGVSGSILEAGRGNGKSEKIRTMGELSRVLDKITGNSSEEAVSTLAVEIDSLKSNVGKNEYDSVTVTSIVSLEASSVVDKPSYTADNVRSKTVKFDRELTQYVQGNNSFYHSIGIVRRTTERDNFKTENEVEEWEMFLFFDGDEERCYINVKEWYVGNSNSSEWIKTEYVGRWIEIPKEEVNSIVDIDYENREIFSAFGELFDLLILEGFIDENERSAFLDEQDINNLYNKVDKGIAYSDGESFSLEIDLSEPTSPYISSYYNSEKVISRHTSIYEGNESYKENRKTNRFYEFYISDINNTVIRFDPENAEVIVINDMDDLFSVETVERDDE